MVQSVGGVVGAAILSAVVPNEVCWHNHNSSNDDDADNMAMTMTMLTTTENAKIAERFVP